MLSQVSQCIWKTLKLEINLTILSEFRDMRFEIWDEAVEECTYLLFLATLVSAALEHTYLATRIIFKYFF